MVLVSMVKWMLDLLECLIILLWVACLIELLRILLLLHLWRQWSLIVLTEVLELRTAAGSKLLKGIRPLKSWLLLLLEMIVVVGCNGSSRWCPGVVNGRLVLRGWIVLVALVRWWGWRELGLAWSNLVLLWLLVERIITLIWPHFERLSRTEVFKSRWGLNWMMTIWIKFDGKLLLLLYCHNFLNSLQRTLFNYTLLLIFLLSVSKILFIILGYLSWRYLIEGRLISCTSHYVLSQQMGLLEDLNDFRINNGNTLWRASINLLLDKDWSVGWGCKLWKALPHLLFVVSSLIRNFHS